MYEKVSAKHARGRAQWGSDYDPSAIDAAAQFHPYYGTDQRIKVRRSYGEEITGRVSSTTGWRPALLLIRRGNASGSSDILGPNDRVIAVKRGRSYVPVDI